jgi:hypothetical protein
MNIHIREKEINYIQSENLRYSKKLITSKSNIAKGMLDNEFMEHQKHAKLFKKRTR